MWEYLLSGKQKNSSRQPPISRWQDRGRPVPSSQLSQHRRADRPGEPSAGLRRRGWWGPGRAAVGRSSGTPTSASAATGPATTSWLCPLSKDWITFSFIFISLVILVSKYSVGSPCKLLVNSLVRVWASQYLNIIDVELHVSGWLCSAAWLSDVERERVCPALQLLSPSPSLPAPSLNKTFFKNYKIL